MLSKIVFFESETVRKWFKKNRSNPASCRYSTFASGQKRSLAISCIRTSNRSKNRLVSEGDIWKVPFQEDKPSTYLLNPGMSQIPSFLTDGKWVAMLQLWSPPKSMWCTMAGVCRSAWLYERRVLPKKRWKSSGGGGALKIAYVTNNMRTLPQNSWP